MNEIKGILLTMGVGFALGAYVASTNRKVAEFTKKAKEMAMEKLEVAKDGVEKIKEKIEDKIEENKEQNQIETDLSEKSNKKTKKA